LKTKPADRAAPVNVRIASTRPNGESVQYDLRYIGLTPGSHDLRGYLVRQDGSPAGDLPPLIVQTGGLLPTQHNGHLHEYRGGRFERFGGYRAVMIGIGGLWVVLAFPFLLAKRRKKAAAPEAVQASPPTLAERLRPLVEFASTSKLTTDQQTQIERMLLGHWRERLGLEKLPIGEAMSQLRSHAEAGALLRTLEDWLYRPPGAANVDVDGLLAPYTKG
jgi:hypothetical protein